jgi:hypothetical protein
MKIYICVFIFALDFHRGQIYIDDSSIRRGEENEF